MWSRNASNILVLGWVVPTEQECKHWTRFSVSRARTLRQPACQTCPLKLTWRHSKCKTTSPPIWHYKQNNNNNINRAAHPSKQHSHAQNSKTGSLAIFKYLCLRNLRWDCNTGTKQRQSWLSTSFASSSQNKTDKRRFRAREKRIRALLGMVPSKPKAKLQ